MTIAKLSNDCEIEINELVATRLLVTANSGGGKSVTLRKIMEETYGKVQHIIIDIEGEFSSLREKFDYLLVGEDGEIPCEIKTSEILARKILELKANVILDLSELKKNDRQIYVKRFLNSLIHAPKNLRNRALVFVDEAHHFAPESAKGKSESTESVIDLMTRGRKRGLCGILSTQRISKLSKDAIAECQNMMIGRIFLDIDQKRAGETIGLTSKNDVRALRDLKAGEFYCVGSAFRHKGVIKTKVDWVKTSHPDRTKGIIEKIEIPTPDKIKAMVSEIGDLPTEANREINNLNDCKSEINELKRKLRISESNKIKPKYDSEKIRGMVSKAKIDGFNECKKQIESENKYLRKENDGFIMLMKKIGRLLDFEQVPKREFKAPEILPMKKFEVHRPITILREYEGDIKLNLCEKKIYSLLYEYSDRDFNYAQIGVFTGYSNRSGGFSNAISHLRNLGLIKGNRQNLQINKMDSNLVGNFSYSKEALISKLNKCEREIFEVLKEYPNYEFTKLDLAERTESNYSSTSGGFSNAISKLNTLGLAKRENGVVKLNPEILEI